MIGTTLGHYEILEKLGEGGMGEVYRARDTKLNREVAIKALPEAFAIDRERVARFEREAQMLAALNHPNIGAIYGFEEHRGERFLVIELVPGESLDQVIARGPVAPDRVVAIAQQIASAVEAAHERGIIHRDLKPANIKLTPDDVVKVLDFGLAKDVAAGGPTDLSMSPTFTAPATQLGVILGTAAYMAPEQARGLVVDKRADIWAFGCVLFELLTGSRPFGGATVSDVLAGVLKTEPDWTTLPPATPAWLRELLRRCLEKDPKRRLRDIGEARIQLELADGGGRPWVPTSAPVTRRPLPRRLLAPMIALVLGAAITGGLFLVRRPNIPPAAPLHVNLALVPGALATAGTFSDVFALSPDGQRLVYTVVRDGRSSLYVRDFRENDGRIIDGTEDAYRPFFSPDGQWIAFAAGNFLKKVSVSGGVAAPICSLINRETVGVFGTAFVGGAWDSTDQIVFVPAFNAGLWTVPASGGTPRLLLETDETKDRIAYVHPRLLPNGRGVLFSMYSGRAITSDDADTAVLAAGELEPRILIRGGENAQYLSTGHLAYTRGGALFAVPFDVATLTVSGTPATLVEGLARNTVGGSLYSVSHSGTLVYEPLDVPPPIPRLGVVDRQGRVESLTRAQGQPFEFALSPDGRSVAARVVAANDDIWVYDLATGTPLRLTFEPGDETNPRWTRDGTRVAYGTRTGSIFWQPADGSAPREELVRGEFARYPASFSPDGKTLAFVEIHPSTRGDIWLLPLDGAREPEPFQLTAADEAEPSFSPDGRWIAYGSDETGRAEVYVRPARGPGGRRRVSNDGGKSPAWSRHGRELVFVRDDELVAVDVSPDGVIGAERLLFDAPRSGDLRFLSDFAVFDAMPDGERFVMLLRPEIPSPRYYNVVVNWFSELEARLRSRS